MPRDSLIFDLDGTLWNASVGSALGWNLALEELGLPYRVTAAGIRSVSGRPFAECVRVLLPEVDPANEDLLSSLDLHERSGVEAAGGILFEGVAEGLAALSQVFPLYLVSNCKDWYLRAFLSFTGFGGLFTECDCHGSSGMEKDAMFSSLVARRGLVSPVYVGDTEGDRASAEAAGIPFAFASYGYGETGSSELSFAGFAQLAAYFLAE